MLKIANLRVEPLAVSDRAGVAELRIPAFSGSETPGMASLSKAAVTDAVVARIVEAQLCSIDQFAFDDVGFIKIDVEGHEESVIHGAIDTIRRCRPAILVEIEERHNAGGLARVRSLLEEIGYAGYFFSQSKRKDIAAFNLAVDQSIPDNMNEALHSRRGMSYINNFLFLYGGAAA
jgi:FkbM family methyltransferase